MVTDEREPGLEVLHICVDLCKSACVCQLSIICTHVHACVFYPWQEEKDVYVCVCHISCVCLCMC